MENKDLPKLVNSQLTYLLSKEKDKDTTIPENPSPYAEDPFKLSLIHI